MIHPQGENWRYNHDLTFWIGYLLSEIRENIETDNESDDNSILPQITSEEEMYVMSSGNESDADPFSMDMPEDICDESYYHSSINRR